MEVSNEEWVDVVGYEGLYEVSSHGRVRRSGSLKIRKQHVDRYGYKVLSMNKDGFQKKAKAHRLVAEAFLRKCKSRDYVDHINGDKLCNFHYNLRWVTAKENSNNPLTLCKLKNNKRKNGLSVVKYNIITGDSHVFSSVRSAAISIGRSATYIMKSCVSNSVNNGFRWDFFIEPN